MLRMLPAGQLISPALLLVWLGVSGCDQASSDISPDSVSPAAETDHPSSAAHGFGAYRNEETALWDGSERTSRYVPAKDRTRLAVDVYLPTRGGEVPSEPVPVVLHYTRYIRALEGEDGVVRGRSTDPVLQHLLRHGYAVAVADARGTGASFGVHHGEFSVEETADSYAIIEWLASQPWSNGKVGMSGRSYPGMTQYQAATQAPPALKAIFAEMAGPSAYDFIYRGGTFKKDFVERWGWATRSQDLGESGSPARVDEDTDGSLRDEALREHRRNLWAHDLIRPGSNLRDFSVERDGGGYWSWDRVIATIDDADAIAASGIGIYHLVGWYDIYTTQQAWLYAALEGSAPQKMMIGPWIHSGGYGGVVHKAELLRWYDYWLKEIENGVLDEEPVHYYVMRDNHTLPADLDPAAPEAPPTLDEAGAEVGEAWTGTDQWPPAAARRKLRLARGRSGTSRSVNDGKLVADGTLNSSADSYSVDYTSRVGSFSRWMSGYGAVREQPAGSTFFDERSSEDAKALTYTTDPLEEALTVVGYPTVHLGVISGHADGDFFVYLEEVDAEGRSHYVSEGSIRASHRKTSPAPFDNFGLPFHRSHADDLAPMVPGEPTVLEFDLMGTAIVFDAGHRIRIAVAGADARNFALYPDPDGRQGQQGMGPPRFDLLRGGERGSYVELPVIESGG